MEKKYRKRLMSWMLVMVCACMALLHPQQVGASLAESCKYLIESGSDWSEDVGKIHIKVNNYELDLIGVIFAEENYSIRNVRSSNKNLRVKNAGSSRKVYRTGTEGNMTETFVEKRVYVSLLAKKAGAYKVDFDICDAAGTVKKHKTIEVYANNEHVFRSLKLNGIKVDEDALRVFNGNYLISESPRASLKANMVKGYQFKRITVENDALGKTRTIGNGESFRPGKFTSVKLYYLDKYTGEEQNFKISVSYWNE